MDIVWFLLKFMLALIELAVILFLGIMLLAGVIALATSSGDLIYRRSPKWLQQFFDLIADFGPTAKIGLYFAAAFLAFIFIGPVEGFSKLLEFVKLLFERFV